MTLEVLARSCDWAERPAFHCPDRTWTHGEVHRNGHRVAGVLFDAGVRPGDRVLLAGADRIELVWAVLGAARIGAVAVLVNPLLSETEHVFMVQDVCPSLVMCDAELVERFDPVACTRALDELSHAAIGPSRLSTSDRTPLPTRCTRPGRQQADPTPPCTATRIPAGHPRRLWPTMRSSCAPTTSCIRFRRPIRLRLRQHDRVPAFLRLLRHPRSGQADRGARLAARVSKNRATVLFEVPSFYAGLVSRGDAGSFRSVRLGRAWAKTLQPALDQRVRSWLGREILDGLGSTEVGQTFISYLPGQSCAGSIGNLLRGDQAFDPLRVQGGRPVGRDRVVPRARGDTVMLGYLNRPRPPAFLDDGWWPTADRALG